MLRLACLIVIANLCLLAQGQRNFGNSGFRNSGGSTTSTRSNTFSSQPQSFRPTPANAVDFDGTEIYPGCNGTVCLPEPALCAKRQNKGGHFRYNKKSYWISWASNENNLLNARWNWFTGRNYCRKMCMDAVSLETLGEQDFIQNLMRTTNDVKSIHTAGRLCDAEVDGCDQPRFQPLHLNGWFWSSTLRMMPQTDLITTNGVLNNWGSRGQQRQPDGALNRDGFGIEACMALVDDPSWGGLKWHDEPCNRRRHIVCEDLPTPNINFVRNNNPGFNIP